MDQEMIVIGNVKCDDGSIKRFKLVVFGEQYCLDCGEVREYPLKGVACKCGCERVSFKGVIKKKYPLEKESNPKDASICKLYEKEASK